MQVSVGYSDIPDSAAAGKQVAEEAIRMSGRKEVCDLVLLFCTTRHNQHILREAVSSVLGSTVPIYGGGTVGVITNDVYGYAGDQVGIACIWLDGVRCDVFSEGGLLGNEENTGFLLGQKLQKFGIKPETPVMLFYDAISRTDDGGIRLNMATWILAGLEKALGFLPDLTGAGLMGDHACGLTSQYIGETIAKQQAMALSFGEDIRIDSVIMHGCRPASPYYTVTRADGPVILEINHKNALSFMDELLGSAIRPEQYPFFLLFGINYGERFGEYDESSYASRLCLGIDHERGGIIMFEPDMVEGTEFQLMFRSLELDYMKPKIESVFDRLDGREPVFALYIDCAGRCAGYGGVDIEDALTVQQAIAGRVPLLGLYTGVEIASVDGRPRGLDWTGVLCLFSKGGSAASEKRFSPAMKSETEQPKRHSLSGAGSLGEASIAPESASDESSMTLEALRKLSEQNAAKILALDTQTITLRYELELKRRGFQLISELAVSLRQTDDYESLFFKLAQRINVALNMEKTILLLSKGAQNFAPVVMQGFTVEEKKLLGETVSIPKELLGYNPVIVTAEDAPERFASLRSQFNLPFFIASSVFVQGEVVALLLTGRMVEQPPYLSRLGKSDLETVHAITELLATVFVHLRLHDVTHKAKTDGLTQLWNRDTFKHMVETFLRESPVNSGIFMIIDIDYFKGVNDTYGHTVGDDVLVACANALRHVFRDSDIIGRQGGDEFAVFCKGITEIKTAEEKAERIRESWKKIIPESGANPVTGSIGIALFPEHGLTFQELFSNADKALYRAKKNNRDRFEFFG